MRTAKARPSRWHLLEVLKPRVPVKRMVFHEITRAAIEHAVDELRATSTTAWSTPRRAVASSTASTATRCPRCAGARSARACRPAGCSRPSVRLVVERERERMAFVAAGYWDLTAAVPHRPRLHRLARRRSTTSASPAAATSTPPARTKREDVAGARRGRRPRLRARLEGQPFTVAIGRDEAVHARSRSRRSSPRRSSRWAARRLRMSSPRR